MEKTKKLLSKDEIIDLIRNATKDNLEQIAQAFIESDLEINDRKEILRLAFKEKGAGLIRSLYKETEKNFKNVLDSNFKKELFELAFNNTSKNPDRSFIVVAEKLISNKQDQIDINELFKKYRGRGIKLIELAIINNNDTGLINFLKEKLGIDNILDKIIEYSDDVDLFNKFFGINTENKECKDFLKYANSTILKIYNIGNKEEMINSILENTKYPINFPPCNDSLISFLNESLLKSIKIDIPSLNKITEKIINKGKLINITKYKNIYKNIKENQNIIVKSDKNALNEPIEIQGENQTEILERNINYNENKYLIESIEDTIYTNLKNENENRKLYEVIYKNNGVQEITYYEKDEKKILAIIEIDKNGELKFNSEKERKKATYNSDEIKRILNDDYKSIDAFDHKLSYLSYALLRNEENVVFKTNCNNIEDIINITRDSIGKNKIFICDLNIDKHNVQIVINNGNTTILNSGKDFEYIKNIMENLIDIKKLQNIKIKHMEIVNQSSGNCVEASKLYTIVLSEKYKQQFGNLEKLTERLNNFQQFMEDTLNKIGERSQNILNNFKETENFEMLKVFLETNVELLNEYEKHFYKIDERFKNFYKTLKKRDKTVSNEEDKIIDNKMEEMHKIANIISFGHEINKACEEEKINNEYNISKYKIA